MNEEEMANLLGYLREILAALTSIDAGLTRLVELAESEREFGDE